MESTVAAENVWIVVPAYNESKRLRAVVHDLQCHTQFPIVVVDDGSRDETPEVLRHLKVHRLRHLINRGQGAALQTGIEFAREQGASCVVTFDADGQHQATDIPRLIRPIIEQAADLVLGSRFLGNTVGMPLFRGIVLRVAVWFTRITTGIRLTDTHNGLRAFSRTAMEGLQITEDGMAHASEILRIARRHQWRICELPVTVVYTKDSLEKGQSNLAAFRILGRIILRKLLV